MIVTFDWQMQKLSSLTSNRKELESGIKQAKVGKFAGTGASRLRSMDVSRNVLQPIRGRKAIILLSDGNDHGSAVTPEELLKTESEADAMIYSIYYRPEGFRFMGPPGFPGRGRGRGGVLFRSQQRNGLSVRDRAEGSDAPGSLSGWTVSI